MRKIVDKVVTQGVCVFQFRSHFIKTGGKIVDGGNVFYWSFWLQSYSVISQCQLVYAVHGLVDWNCNDFTYTKRKNVTQKENNDDCQGD